MAFRKKLFQTVLIEQPWRLYSSAVNLKKLQPIILKRIENQSRDYPVRALVPVAEEVLKARNALIQGVSTLIKSYPVVACKLVGYTRRAKNLVHEWVSGRLNDILVPIETFHLGNMFQGVIKHNQRFDFDRIPAVVELRWQAGADPYDEKFNTSSWNLESINGNVHGTAPSDELALIANKTLMAWETFRSGVQKLLFVYPVKVYKYCSEVHVGPSGHKARLCGLIKYESWQGAHFWMKANVDDLVPPKIVWGRRPQDPPVLVDEGRDFYGRVPAVLDMCAQAGAKVPAKYNCMMKVQGAHAIGVSHCSSFSNWLYNFTGVGDEDPALESGYATNVNTFRFKNPSESTTSIPGSRKTFDL